MNVVNPPILIVVPMEMHIDYGLGKPGKRQAELRNSCDLNFVLPTT